MKKENQIERVKECIEILEVRILAGMCRESIASNKTIAKMSLKNIVGKETIKAAQKWLKNNS